MTSDEAIPSGFSLVPAAAVGATTVDQDSAVGQVTWDVTVVLAALLGVMIGFAFAAWLTGGER